MNDQIKLNNKEIIEAYPAGKNHKGMVLQYFNVHGYTIVAFTEPHARNIYQQILIDL